jgi:transposase
MAVLWLGCASSVNEAATLLRISWRGANAIMQRSVERGLTRRQLVRIEHLGIDEKSFRKRHRYGTLINDLDQGRVLEVVEERTQEAAVKALESLGPSITKQVDAIALDMSAAYSAAVRQTCPQADLVCDKWHVEAMPGKAIDTVRRSEHKALSAAGDERLKGTRHNWLYNPENLSPEAWQEFEALTRSNLKAARAWRVRQDFKGFWKQRSRQKAEAWFERWYARAMRCRMEPVKQVARSLKRHLGGLLNYTTHRITNALSESLNSRIQAIRSAARGFHSFAAFRTRALFFLGKLDLQPR